MKKAFISPLASGLVIPGLGQVLNHQLKKGVVLLLVTLGLFVALLVQLYSIINFMIKHPRLYPFSPDGIMKALADYHPTALFAVIAGFVALWIYSVVDALIYGIKVDQTEDKDSRDASLSY